MKDLPKNPYLWKTLALLLGIILVAFLTFNYVIMPSYTRHRSSVTIPDVRNLPYERAEQLLTQHQLKPVKRIAARYNPDVPPGIVLDQNPPPDFKVKPGRRVYLIISTDSLPLLPIPDVRTLSPREAKLRIEEAGFKLRQILEDSIPSPYPNTITGQMPAPGDSAQKGTEITLWVSKGLGSKLVEVPDVMGMPVQQAHDVLLYRYHLRPVLIKVQDKGIPETVVRQEPEAGMQLREGSEIRLYVISEPQEAETRRGSTR